MHLIRNYRKDVALSSKLNLFNKENKKSDSLEQVASHEFGHSAGLYHPHPRDPNNTSKDHKQWHDPRNESGTLAKKNVMRTGPEREMDNLKSSVLQAQTIAYKERKGQLNRRDRKISKYEPIKPIIVEED